MKKQRAVYPGTFDPMTNGHLDLIRRGAALFDSLTVGVAVSPHKKPLFGIDERVAFVEDATAGLAHVTVKSFDNLLVDFTKEVGAGVIVKGVRAFADFEHELQMCLVNRRLAPALESIFLMPSEEYSFVSSTMLKEVASMGGDLKHLAPPNVIEALKIRFGQ